MTTSAMARVGKKLFRTAVVIAEQTVHGTSLSVKRFVDTHPNARGTAPYVGESSQPRWRGLDRRLEGEHAFRLQLSLEYFVAAGGVKFVKTRPAEAEVRQPGTLRFGNDPVHSSGLVAELHAKRGVDIKSPV